MENKPMISEVRVYEFNKEPSMCLVDHFVFPCATLWVLKEKVTIEEAFVNVLLFDAMSCEIMLVKAKKFHPPPGLSIRFSFVTHLEKSQINPEQVRAKSRTNLRLAVTCPRLACDFP
jgi:hypothetical protein